MSLYFLNLPFLGIKGDKIYISIETFYIFRRKLHIRGLTFDELLHSILGFNNSGNIGIMLETLDQEETCSLMRGLNRSVYIFVCLLHNLKH